MIRKFIKSRINNLYIASTNLFFNIRNFLWTFIDQKNDQMHIRIILLNRFGNIFQKGCLAGFRW